MTEPIKVQVPLTAEVARELKAGDIVLLTGTLLTARDAAHKRLIGLVESGRDLPLDLAGQVIYYVGPAPAKPGLALGSAGPTSSYRMDVFTPKLLELGLKGMIGKGKRGPEVKAAMAAHGAVYFAATGGAAALIAKSITHSEMVAYEDLGPEAIRRLTVKDFPAIVAVDSHGGDIYEAEWDKYRRE